MKLMCMKGLKILYLLFKKIDLSSTLIAPTHKPKSIKSIHFTFFEDRVPLCRPHWPQT